MQSICHMYTSKTFVSVVHTVFLTVIRRDKLRARVGCLQWRWERRACSLRPSGWEPVLTLQAWQEFEVQFAVYFSFRNCHLFYLIAVVCTTGIMLYHGTVWQERQISPLHTYANHTNSAFLPFNYMVIVSCKNGMWFSLILQCYNTSSRMTSLLIINLILQGLGDEGIQ